MYNSIFDIVEDMKSKNRMNRIGDMPSAGIVVYDPATQDGFAFDLAYELSRLFDTFSYPVDYVSPPEMINRNKPTIIDGFGSSPLFKEEVLSLIPEYTLNMPSLDYQSDPTFDMIMTFLIKHTDDLQRKHTKLYTLKEKTLIDKILKSKDQYKKHARSYTETLELPLTQLGYTFGDDRSLKIADQLKSVIMAKDWFGRIQGVIQTQPAIFIMPKKQYSYLRAHSNLSLENPSCLGLGIYDCCQLDPAPNIISYQELNDIVMSRI
jgi:hypothetical protein